MGETQQATVAEEPVLAIPRPPRFRPFGVALIVAACLVASGAALIVFRDAPSVVTVKGIMASKQDFFNDEEVQRLLLQHNFRVEVTARGSREVAMEVTGENAGDYDFAFPSGQPAADLIKNYRSAHGQYQNATSLFSSPMVLATYREYAEVLVHQGVAARLEGSNGLYYTLDTAKFIDLGEQGKTWNQIQTGDLIIPNGNRVLAHTSGVCRSNSGATYLGLIAFVENNRETPRPADIDRLAQRLQPLIAATGMPEADLFETYRTPEGKSQGPIVVVYEHQFLAYQLAHRERTGKPDDDRVLLYPREEFQTDPEFIALKQGPADQLAQLLNTDPELRTRMMQLGFRLHDGTDTVGSPQLFEYLHQHDLPVPTRTDATRAFLPNLDLLESLIVKTGGCTR